MEYSILLYGLIVARAWKQLLFPAKPEPVIVEEPEIVYEGSSWNGYL